ncbi:MAG: Putative periplasmic protein [uncultured Sulfurovum sp.]|uniref:Periplasmic protein n=1 Tax=uncultured Sulfurovum sp. TaxID=269237 RepID=A0A6S6SQD6_9BACT|nr:MAG: Putative periplasmic protein [uncultured Sulfurovum sp.]
MKTLITFLFILTIGLFAGDVEYSYVPKKVYEKQVFPISFLTTTNESISFNFQGDKKPVLKKPVIIKNGSKTFYTFYFKTTEKLFTIPKVIVNINGQTKELSTLKIPVKKIPQHKYFSGVIGSELKIKNHQVSVYDEKTNLVAISLEAHDANLEDIYIPSALKDGTENAQRTGSKMEIHYYIVLPSEQKELKFSYFDTIKENFVEKSIPIELQDGSVAAQTDLNPKDDSFEALKKYTLLILSIFFVLLFLWKRDFFYLVMAVISAAVLLTFYTALATVCVKEGSPLYIIPTSNSSTSVHIDQKFKTTKLAERNEFVKIEYINGTVGWIKHEDLCED